MESGVIADSQINASSFLEWPEQTGQPNTWRPERARLKRPGHSWAALTNDEYQWLQIDLNKEQRITGKQTCLYIKGKVICKYVLKSSLHQNWQEIADFGGLPPNWLAVGRMCITK